jgi:hypothetical protein
MKVVLNGIFLQQLKLRSQEDPDKKVAEKVDQLDISQIFVCEKEISCFCPQTNIFSKCLFFSNGNGKRGNPGLSGSS